MKHYFMMTALIASISPFSAHAEATDQFQHGRETHENHCYKCHSDSMYTRQNSVVRSINALGTQVRRCKDGLGITWFDEDTDAVIHFLNRQYYKF